MNLQKAIIHLFLILLITTTLSCGGGDGDPKDPTTPPKPLPTEYAAIRQLEADAETQTFDLLNGGMEIKDALTEVVNWAKTQPIVADSGLYEDEKTAWIEFTGGQGTAISIINETDRSDQYFTSLSFEKSYYDKREISNRVMQDFIIADEPKYAFIILAGAFCDPEYPPLSLMNLNYGYTGAKRYESNKPTVLDFYNLNQYSFIFIQTHGNKDILITGEEVPSIELQELLSTQEWIDRDLIHSIVISQDPTGTQDCGTFYALKPSFFTKAYKDRNFEDGSIIILDACMSHPNFTNAFLSVGATSVLGWESESSRFSELDAIFQKVCPQDPKADTLSLAEAVQQWNSDMALWDRFSEKNFLPDGTQDLWLLTDDPSANPIPIIDEVTTEGAGDNTRVIIKGNFGTLKSGQIGFLVNEATDWNQAIYVQILGESWTSTEASMPIPGNLSYGKYQVRIRANGILSNVKEFTFTPPNPIEMTVGPYHLTFSNAYAGWIVDTDDFAIFFMEQPGVAYPFASIEFMGNASALTTGVPLYPYGIAGYVNQDILHTMFNNDDEYPCEVIFSLYELKPLGRVSGTLTGSVRADFDADDEWELYPISCTFENILVFTQQSYPPQP